jgi:hypothetical protein
LEGCHRWRAMFRSLGHSFFEEIAGSSTAAR